MVDFNRTCAVGSEIHLVASRFTGGKTLLKMVLAKIDAYHDANGLDPLDPFPRSEKHTFNFVPQIRDRGDNQPISCPAFFPTGERMNLWILLWHS